MTTKVEDLSARVDTLTDSVGRITQLLESLVQKPAQEAQKPAQEVESNDKTSMGTIRQWAKDNGHQVKDNGRIPSEVLTAYARAHANGKPKLTVVTGSKVIAAMNVKRDGVSISADDAAEALRTHPMRESVLGFSSGQWATIRQMGSAVKVNGKSTGDTHENPANLSGWDRKMAHMLALKSGSAAKPWTLYQGCLILAKLQAAGFAV